ncbi:MerR family transcriptional regulator [Geomonas subterranea]|uniref:MerR family transcriptional regulator n=1 Tax=Geomonas subterranea TaxID=2847989 RepID=A0ABX8LGK4_9BACT|nr:MULTISPECIES: MerR family transcriptional regulator [Geomonas]QXE91158.1 MerR family transcriptional regulator [Geomonas subterranea]QXM10755.1 MerR family transcriptional regulator [Geomonas subterranea]
MDIMKDGEEITSIGDVAAALGLTTRTIRYWEEVGIIESVPRSDGATRGFTPYYVRRIKFIIKLKELGLTIKEMQDLYAAYGEAKQTERMVPRLVEILDEHIEKIDDKMARLASLRSDIASYRQHMVSKFGSSQASGA